MDSALTTAPRPRLRVVEGPGTGRVALRAPARLHPRRAWALACLSVDAAMLALAALATWIGAHAAGLPTVDPVSMAVFGGLSLVLFQSRGLYTLRLRLSVLDDARAIVLSVAIAAMVVLTLRALTGHAGSELTEVVRPWAFATAYLTAGRVALYWAQTKARVAGEIARPTLIVGAGRIGTVIAKRLLERPELGLKPVAFLDDEPRAEAFENVGLPVVGASWDLDETVARYGIEQVVVAFSAAPDAVLLQLVRRCEELGVSVAIVPRLFERMREQVEVEHLGGIPLVMPRPADPRAWRFTVKYALDRVIAAALVLLTLPLLAAIALGVRVSLGSPILFRQRRIGRDGQPFELLKFRSMRPEPAGSGASLLLPDDTAPGGVEGEDRRTPFGSFLRRTSLDELPQLLNVLRGDMSLVGPRPERPEFVSQFERSVYRYGDRHRIKSGITGWAQVHGLRGKTSIADRAEWDNHYIESFSLWLDVKILLSTAKAVLGAFRSVE